MRRSRVPVAFLLGCLLIGATLIASRAEATSTVVHPQLAGARDFRVFVSTREGKQRLRNIRETEYQLSNSIIDALRAGGLRYEDQSTLSLILIVEYDYEPEVSKWVGLSVRLELHEEVRLVRNLPKKARPGGLRAITWSQSAVDLVPAEHAEATMVAKAKEAAEEFVKAVQHASATYQGRE